MDFSICDTARVAGLSVKRIRYYSKIGVGPEAALFPNRTLAGVFAHPE